MKIAYVFDDSLDRPDGVQQAVITTGEWMRSQGHDVHYLVGRTERKDLDNIHSLANSWRVKFNGNTLSTPLPTSSKMLESFLNSEKFDVLHVQMPYSPFFAERIIKRAPQGTKIIGTFHILPYSKLSQVATKQLGRFLKKSLRRFSSFVSVSAPAADFARASFGISSVVIPNPVQIDRFNTPKSSHSGTRKRIIFLGRLEERKGVVELLKAYKYLLLSEPKLVSNSELLIGGKGPLRDKVHADILNMPKGSQVEMLGFVPEQDKAALLESADVAVFPSTGGESFGIILVEAMAAGARLVIGGNNPGYSSVIGEKPELLFDPRNTDQFAKKISWALKETKEIQILHKWQSTHVRQYDVSEVGKKLLRLYKP